MLGVYLSEIDIGDGITYCGPNILADNFESAETKLFDKCGEGYKIIGKLQKTIYVNEQDYV